MATAAEQVKDYLDKQGEAHTVAEIADATGVNPETASRELRKLRDKGEAQVVGVADGGAKTWGRPTAEQATKAEVQEWDETLGVSGDATVELIDKVLSDATEVNYAEVSAERAADGADNEDPRPAEAAAPEGTSDTWGDEETEAYVQRMIAEDNADALGPLGYVKSASGTWVKYDPEDIFADDDPDVEHGEPETVTTDVTPATVERMTTATATKPAHAPHARGGLELEILAFLAEHKDETFTPHRLANFDKENPLSGTGAVAYALNALTKKGKVNQVAGKGTNVEGPMTYGYRPESEWPAEQPKRTRKAKAEAAAE